MNKNDKLILAGVVLSPHGIRGEIIVKSFTDPKINIKNLPLVDESGNPVKIEYFKNHKENFIVKLNQISNRNDAQELKSKKIYCFRSSLPKLEIDEFYISDLIDLEVRDHNNRVIGKIIDFHDYGAGGSCEIKFIDYNQTELFLFTKEIFTQINVDHVIFKRPYVD